MSLDESRNGYTASLRVMRMSAARWSARNSAAKRRQPAALIATVGAFAPAPPYLRSCEASGSALRGELTGLCCDPVQSLAPAARQGLRRLTARSCVPVMTVAMRHDAAPDAVRTSRSGRGTKYLWYMPHDPANLFK